MSEFYTKTGNPANRARGLSALMRAEFALIEAAFSKLPDYSAAALKIWRVNAGGTGVEAVSAGALLSSDVAFTGDISPTQLTANADNYNPTGLSTSSVLRLSSDASRNITGLDGGADGRLLLVHNIGSFNIVLKDADTGSDADNRFALDADVTLRPDWCVLLQYDVTSFRWRMVGLQASAFMQTLLDDADAATARTTLGLGDLAVLSTVGASQFASDAIFVGAQGRLTLTSGTPVTTSDVTGATTLYFTPYKGNKVELYNGTGWTLSTFTELSQATTDTTKSPAAVANNSNYDLFVWNDSGTLRCTRGPAWTSDTARGTGAGTTELELFDGRYVNKIAITNGPAAQRGLYVGTVRSDGSAQVNDSVAKRHVWNNFNRVVRPMQALEATDNWTYTTASFRQANANTANQLDYVAGLSETPVSARVLAIVRNSGVVNTFHPTAGVGVDSTTVSSAQLMDQTNNPAADSQIIATAQYRGYPGIGRHTLVWLERSTATGITTWIGDAGAPTIVQSGIIGEVMA